MLFKHMLFPLLGNSKLKFGEKVHTYNRKNLNNNNNKHTHTPHTHPHTKSQNKKINIVGLTIILYLGLKMLQQWAVSSYSFLSVLLLCLVM